MEQPPEITLASRQLKAMGYGGRGGYGAVVQHLLVKGTVMRRDQRGTMSRNPPMIARCSNVVVSARGL
jgi:hypothetical protein